MSVSELILERVRAAGGAGRTRHLAKNSRERSVLAQLVRTGTLERMRVGCYAFPETGLEIKLACLTASKITCVSAVDVAGLRTLIKPHQVHISATRNFGKPHIPPDMRDRLVLHRDPIHWFDQSLLLPRRAAPSPVGIPQTSLLLAPWPIVFARLAICCSFKEAVVALDSGLNSGVIRKLDVLTLLNPRHHKSARKVVEASCASSQSVLETLARLQLRQAGFRVQPQARITGVGNVDLLVENRVVVELDGYSHHSDRDRFRADRYRDRELAKLGCAVLRFTYTEVMNNRALIATEVRAVLARQSVRATQPTQPT